MTVPIIDKIQTVDNLPSLPTVAMELLEMTRAEDVALADIAQVVQKDPALTAKILRAANSPLFGMHRQISTLPRAMLVLGLRAVKVMVLSFSLAEALKDDKTSGFDYTAYWRRSLITATSAHLISKAIASPLAQEAFVAGLLSDVGMVAAWRCARDLYQPVLEDAAAHQSALHDIERERLGVTHAAIGRKMLIRWSLPEILCEPVRTHHGEGLEALSGEVRQCARLVHCGAAIAQLFCQDVPLNELQNVKEKCHELVGIDQNELDDILEQLSERTQETAALLAVNVGQVISYTHLQERAALQLAQLSMQAEVERAAASDHVQQAQQQAQRLQQENQTIREAASTDSLTGIANRAAFDKRLAEELEQARAKCHFVGLIMLDIDHFKHLNDAHGHQAGDEVLRHLGSCLREIAQQMAFVARYGGEEFAVILANETAERLTQLAEGIRQAIQQRRIEHDGHQLRVTASLGAAWTQPADLAVSGEQLIQRADQCLYLAKRSGRNCVRMPDI